jgi:hypothetical protein
MASGRLMPLAPRDRPPHAADSWPTSKDGRGTWSDRHRPRTGCRASGSAYAQRARRRVPSRKDHARETEALIPRPCSMLVLARENRMWRPARSVRRGKLSGHSVHSRLPGLLAAGRMVEKRMDDLLMLGLVSRTSRPRGSVRNSNSAWSPSSESPARRTTSGLLAAPSSRARGARTRDLRAWTEPDPP